MQSVEINQLLSSKQRIEAKQKQLYDQQKLTKIIAMEPVLKKKIVKEEIKSRQLVTEKRRVIKQRIVKEKKGKWVKFLRAIPYRYKTWQDDRIEEYSEEEEIQVPKDIVRIVQREVEVIEEREKQIDCELLPLEHFRNQAEEIVRNEMKRNFMDQYN